MSIPDMPPLPAADASRLQGLHRRLLDMNHSHVGYPCNQWFDYRHLLPFLDISINNVGDPWKGSSFTQNTHEIECEVIRDFAALTQAPAGEYWGYVTNGGTEGNMYGLYLARELFPDGVVYFSEDTHYSVPKILRLQHTRNIMIRSLPDGRMDCEDLRETLRIHRDVPPIIFANIGTTMKGAIDDLAAIRTILEELAIPQHYIHADAALSGMVLPFMDDPQPWHFGDGVDSLSISGHKMIGGPLPCGVAMARKHHVDRIARGVEYVGALDTTISGSRNGITPLILWSAFRQLGQEGMRERARHAVENCRYAVARLQDAGIQAWCHRNSLTVVFPRPPAEMFRKWIIAPHRKIGHMITMPHVTRAIIDEFVADFAASIQPTSTP